MENSAGGGAVVQGQGEQAGAGGGRTGWQLLRSILFQMVIFYFITSFFRGRQQSPPAQPEGAHPAVGTNLFPKGQEMVSGHCLESRAAFRACLVCGWWCAPPDDDVRLCIWRMSRVLLRIGTLCVSHRVGKL